MVRFSCFPSHVHSHKQKKSVPLSADEMHKTLQDGSSSQALKNSTSLAMENVSDLEMNGDILANDADHVMDSYTDGKSERIELKSNTESDIDDGITARMKKSMSLGSGLDWKGKASSDNESEYETDKKFSCNASLTQSEARDFQISSASKFLEGVPSDSMQRNAELVNSASIFSIVDPQESTKEVQENYDAELLYGAGESDQRTPCTPHSGVSKCGSLPNMRSPGNRSTCSLHRSRSTEDLNVTASRRKGMSSHEIGTLVINHDYQDDSAVNNGKRNCENAADDSYDTYNYVGSAKEWIVPVQDEVTNSNKGQSLFCHWDDLPNKDFKIKRIEEWVVDLQHYNPSEETDEPSPPISHEEPKNENIFDSATPKLESKVNPSTEAVKKYLSSLSATSTAAQLANQGLVVIPFLSAFTSLRAVNLSGNAIVRISAGSLPRGLHVLNLSKNSIATIEGLRELTRLRILDLSYNRILRIGHGLASCSSVKELYLAGNKISEVEGLHRLLKLNVLDLRFNKISTTKCIGQLAANYNSLQAIGLEGNPAQKNVGDEQLKKYLQGLLPHLAYYNRQAVKVGTSKDGAERSARIGIGSHQIDRSLRSELKTIRKGSHGVVPHKASSSLTHGRRGHHAGGSKASRSRNGRLPPPATKINSTDFSSKLLNVKPHLSITRSRSEGTLGAL